MTDVVSTLFVALDGVVEPDEVWHFPYFDDRMGAAVGDDYAGTDVLLLGRVTYDSFAGAWPDREAAGGDDAPFAATLGDLRKIVATHDDGDLGWRNVEATDDVVATVRALKDAGEVSKVLIPGSISVVRQLLAAGLLDELRLFLHPATGGGSRLRLFADDDVSRAFELVSATALPKGAVRLIYRTATAPDERPYEDVAAEVPSGA
ncbi:dihydrofolate reductase [Isoptericola jiangsuensis]|uniref:Dihydrofolate reductase n=1 Tax=Isoptericola jiangsuensis TaxID=548579 RepID=A0A2A9EZP9_9MICO|nr:dihydrofolate reductase family protein [Isoptericola jiangsuensis]PFG44627.1 dihydrofolate reductase [Isoptericola jiangsuensis]